MRRFSDLVSVARVDAAGSIFGFFWEAEKEKKIELRFDKPRSNREREPDTVKHTYSEIFEILDGNFRRVTRWNEYNHVDSKF